jgi:hypothetical protein
MSKFLFKDIKRIFIFRKKHKNFHFFSPPEKCEKMSKNSKKKINTFFLEKKIFFLIFLEFSFFMENRQIGLQNNRNMCLRDINNLGEKLLKILKCVKVNTFILVNFQVVP